MGRLPKITMGTALWYCSSSITSGVMMPPTLEKMLTKPIPVCLGKQHTLSLWPLSSCALSTDAGLTALPSLAWLGACLLDQPSQSLSCHL